jgi:hypothetical protein
MHTKGPWEVCGGYTPEYSAIASREGYIVFGMADYATDKEQGKPIKAPSYDTQRDNIRLMACAPELLDSLKTAVRWLRQIETKYPGEFNEDAIEKHLESAVKKAEGNESTRA